MTDITRALAPRILVVDDDPAIGGTIKRYLRQYDIEIADCVQDALDRLRSHTYDLMLLDRRLPDGLGELVIDETRKRMVTMPIIMMSGDIDHQALQRLQNAPDDYIEKPFVRDALVPKIDRLLAAYTLRKQAAAQKAELADMHERREREIDVARTIFDRMFARGQFDKDRVRHLVLAADRLAGDVVFGAMAGPHRYRWMIGDVTGHTLSSALVTLPLAGIFYRATQQDASLTALLSQMEKELVMMLPASMFCVGAVCELDRKAGTLQVWNGGNPDVLIRHGNGDVTQIESTGLPLGADRFGSSPHVIMEHRVEPGDRIYAFSDGLTELQDRRGQMIGFDKLLDTVRHSEPAQIFGKLLDWIPDHTGAVGYDDDISLIEVIV